MTKENPKKMNMKVDKLCEHNFNWLNRNENKNHKENQKKNYIIYENGFIYWKNKNKNKNKTVTNYRNYMNI